VFGSILHRMILWELVKVFLLALIGLTGILLMAGIIAEASQQGLGPGQILAAIPLLVPSTLPYTIPATTLFATCVVYGRLAADNEILAIRSAGINIFKVLKPALLLGVVMSSITMGLSYDIIPYTHRLLRMMVFNDAEELMYSLLRKHNMISHSQLPYAMYVQGVKGKKLLWPVVKRKNEKGQIDYVVHAREAELRVSMTKRMLQINMKHGVVAGEDGSRAYFDERVWELELPKDFGKPGQARPRDMLWHEVLDDSVRVDEEIEKLVAKLSMLTAESLLKQPPFDLPGRLDEAKERLHIARSQRLSLDVELQMRPALSLGCLCFILVGCPVGIWFSRSDYLSSFITCFLPIVFIYYPLLLGGTGMAKDGRYPVVPMIWGADVLVGTWGLLLFWRLMRN
jgi:lipopolysaccharide export system permease protein